MTTMTEGNNLDDLDRNVIVNLFRDWIDASTPHHLMMALTWLNQQAKLRRYPGADKDFRGVTSLIRNAMEEQFDKRRH